MQCNSLPTLIHVATLNCSQPHPICSSSERVDMVRCGLWPLFTGLTKLGEKELAESDMGETRLPEEVEFLDCLDLSVSLVSRRR